VGFRARAVSDFQPSRPPSRIAEACGLTSYQIVAVKGP
jgi:hypothetical protein